MTQKELEAYVRQKLIALDKQADMQEIVHKSKFSFGMDAATYSHLPSWMPLLKQKKMLVRLYRASAILLPLMTLVVGGQFFESGSVWWKEVLKLLIATGLAALFYGVSMYFSFFVKVRQTEREARKLIYEDILYQLKKEREAVS